ncbi:hypothetical protein B566_EDAN014052 [Ephemera danica]|nr:hypothetical protein B566_EDAN014052 [Ephemera danica]
MTSVVIKCLWQNCCNLILDLLTSECCQLKFVIAANMRAYNNRGNHSSSSHQRRPGSNSHQNSRRYSNRREQQDTLNSDHTYSSINSYNDTSSAEPDFSQPPPSKPIDVSKSNLSAEAPEFIPRWQQNDNFNNITTDFSLQSQQYVLVCPTTIFNQFSSTTLLQHEQFPNYVDESHTTEPSTLHDENCEENGHSINETEEKQFPHEFNSNVEDNGIEEVNEQLPEQVDCEQKTENDTNETKKESSHESRGNREQKQRTNYGENTHERRRRNVHSSENDMKSDDRKNNNHGKEGTDVKHTSKRSTNTQSFVRQHPTRNSRGESGSFRRNQRKDTDGKPLQTEKQRESKPPPLNNGQKSVHFQLPQADIPVPQTPTGRSFSQVLKAEGKPSQPSNIVATNVVDSVSHTPQSSGITEHSDTVDSPCPDTNNEVEQDNSKAWKKETNVRPSNRPSTVSKLNFVEMPIGEDLFTAPETFSLAHCVGADFRMGMGIATIFKKKFQRVDELKKSKTKIGGVASLQDDKRFIFYLVTKEKSNIDPYFDDLQASLLALRDECLRLGIRKLAMPRLGCGLDKLLWDEVRNEIQKIFADIEMEIRVYFIPYSKSEPTS